MKSKIKYWLLTIFVLFILYLFWGPLFPWNPFKKGYEKIASSRATVYICDRTPRDSAVFRVTEIIREEEKFHDLQYRNDFKVIILSEESNMKRYLPWINGSGYSVSLGIGDVVYIGPNARRSSTGIEPYLKHELSHLLIDQNTTYDKSAMMHQQGWLVEGIAEYFSGHMFLSKDEFIELASDNKFDFKSLHEGNPLELPLFDTRLNYTHYRLFVEFLVDSRGLEKFQEYLKRYIDNPQNYRELFPEVYSVSLEELLKEHNLVIRSFVQ